MNQAIDDLMREHRIILTAISVLDSARQKIELNQPIDFGDIEKFLKFLKEFADKCHHGKEEAILFPALITAGISKHSEAIDVMLQEHTEGRDWIAQMESSIKPELKPKAFIRAAQGYADLLRSHIQKENEILFPMADKLLSPSQLKDIFLAFEQHEERVMGGGRHEQLHNVLHVMSDRFLAH